MSEFMADDPVLAKLVSEINDPSELQNAILQYYQRQGYAAAPTPVPGAPTPDGYLTREVQFGENSGKRTLIIRARTSGELDELERQVTR
jgi:hypothetical protein